MIGLVAVDIFCRIGLSLAARHDVCGALTGGIMRIIPVASVAVLSAAFALAGCGKGGEQISAQNASVEIVASKAKDAVRLEPGQWEMTFEIGKMDIPGMPAGAPAMKQAAHTSSRCITAEEAAKPAGDMFAGKGAGNCTFDQFEMAGGKLNATMSCKLPNMPGLSKAVMSGTYSPTAFSNEVTSTVSGMPGGQTMTMQAKSSGRRTGECVTKAS
jgi:hypothetical protein